MANRRDFLLQTAAAGVLGTVAVPAALAAAPAATKSGKGASAAADAASSARARELMKQTIVWDNHSCMPLRPEDESFLPQLIRPKKAGFNFVFLNVHCATAPVELGFAMIETLRRFISAHPDDFVFVQSVADIEAAKASGKLAVAFDVEGGLPVATHPGLVKMLYQLGVRWMLLAYNENNRLGGGCMDKDTGLTDYGRKIIDEMERVGMVLDCSHTGYQTVRDAIEYSKHPVIFSHSNPLALKNHPRNIPDDLMQRCARTGGVMNINGIGAFLGDNDNSTAAIVKHIDYAVQLIGAEHVGLGLDYVYDRMEVDPHFIQNPNIYPPAIYGKGLAMVEPERVPQIVEALLRKGYKDKDVLGILGENNLRVARQVWKPVSA